MVVGLESVGKMVLSSYCPVKGSAEGRKGGVLSPLLYCMHHWGGVAPGLELVSRMTGSIPRP